MLFSETARHPVFSATMSRHRFSFLYAVLSFDDPEEQRGLWGSDPFAAARELNVIFNDQMKSVLLPSEYLSIDEPLYTMRHQINFRQHNPNKPAKYGLLYKSLSDARFPFTYRVVPYCGKPVEGTGPYYLNVTKDYVKHLAQSMSVSSMKGRIYRWTDSINQFQRRIGYLNTTSLQLVHLFQTTLACLINSKMLLREMNLKAPCIGSKNMVTLFCVPIQQSLNRKEKRTSFYYQQCDHFSVLHVLTESVNQPS